MNTVLRLLLVLIATAISAISAVPDEIRENLNTLIPESIKLLEAKDHVTFLQTVVPPEDFKKITAKAPVEEFAAKFAENKAGGLLAILKAVKDTKAKVSDDGNSAVFEIPESAGSQKNTITFTRIENRWYIKN